MGKQRWWLGVVGLLLVGPALLPLCAGDPVPAAKGSAEAIDAAALSARIDQLIAARWQAEHVKPAPVADDAEFVRRIYLDLAGRIPRAFEVRDFLDDPNPIKRRRVVETLLESPNYVNHFTNVWRDLLLPQNNNPQLQALVPGFEAWLRLRIRANVPYDQMVREIITARTGMAMMTRMPSKPSDPTPVAFYQANELKPENLAAATSRLFLGVKLECAQCHNHPREAWTREQFWQYAAFFAGVQTTPPSGKIAYGKGLSENRALEIPGSGKIVLARYLDGTEPRWQPDSQPREVLASWMTGTQNHLFARTAANRLWAHFFGIGIIDPVDEAGDLNPPSHPELLDELARQFVAHHFDVKYLIRAITGSGAYQLTSAGPKTNPEDAHLFARMAIRAMTPEQLFDSLALATGYREQTPFYAPDGSPAPNTPRAEFLAKFAGQERRTEAHTTILQALALMNGRFIDDATSIERSETLAAVTDAPFLNTTQRIETLYIASLGRKPRAEEIGKLVKYVDSGGVKSEPKSALADVFWALLNSAEFMLNH
jgi:hypothetical protein